ncbi:hypothetical protein Cgig2_014919 [Carnegiea gigantea]|uniref:Uncharacterized protein n=1 Tax=Carnegiea gigantea TaxID=171969 RepID=A0A9Q1GJY6_9CARY|nr:hypothetical protein Cgig2_014919 [Carnegiea gigantea]
MYFLGLLVDEALPLLLPTVLNVSCHLLWSGVPSLKDRQPRPCLLCIKQNGSQVRPKEENLLTLGRPVPLETFLRIKSPAAARKKSFAKNFNLGSQFKGSLSLDLLFLLLGPFTNSMARAINLGIGRGLSSSRMYNWKWRAVFLSSVVGSLKGFLTSLPSFQLGTFPKPSSRRRKRKLYFQCFTFDFFSMVFMNPSLLLKQYHPKSPGPSRWYAQKNTSRVGEATQLRKSKTIVESQTINSYTFRGQLNHGGIHLMDHKGIPSRQEGRSLGWESDCLDHPTGPSGLGPLGTPVLLPQSLALILQVNGLFS